MPRNVRNFWIELSVDGRDSTVETGPVRKDGGFEMTIRMRDQGSISPKTMRIVGTENNGSLQLLAFTNDDVPNLVLESKR